MVTKSELKEMFASGSKPTGANFALLIDRTFNESEGIKLRDVTTLSFTGIAVTVNDSVATFTDTYGQAGITHHHIQGNKYIVVYELENVGTIAAGRFGIRFLYALDETGYGATNDYNDIVFGTLNIGQIRKGHHIYTTDRGGAYCSPTIISNSVGAQIRIRQKIYDITTLSENQINNVDWDNEWDGVIPNTTADVAEVANSVIYRGSQWQGKKWLSLGDSITSPGTYQNLVKEQLGFATVVNKAIGGHSIQQIATSYTLAELQDTDLITIYGFFNNYFPNAPGIGALSDVANLQGSTYTSVLKGLLEKLLNDKPSANIVLIGTHNGSDSYRPAWNVPIRDGKNISDYLKATEEVARLYSIPYIDMFGKSGINQLNYTLYTTDGLHLNARGHEKISTILVNELQRLQPL